MRQTKRTATVLHEACTSQQGCMNFGYFADATFYLSSKAEKLHTKPSAPSKDSGNGCDKQLARCL